MKTNNDLGFEQMVQVGNYVIGKKGATYRGYGYQWHGEQDASREFAHHEVCGRGATAEEAVEALIAAAIRAGEAGLEGGCCGLSRAAALRLRDELVEALAELAD